MATTLAKWVLGNPTVGLREVPLSPPGTGQVVTRIRSSDGARQPRRWVNTLAGDTA